MEAVLDVFSLCSTGFHFWRVALDLVCRFSIFNLRSDHLLRLRCVFRMDIHDVVLFHYCLWGFCFLFFLLFVLAFGLIMDLLSWPLGLENTKEL
jgi:hypothetical protein